MPLWQCQTLPFESQLSGLRSFITLLWTRCGASSLHRLPLYCQTGIMAAKIALTEGSATCELYALYCLLLLRSDTIIQERGRCFRRSLCLIEEFGLEVLGSSRVGVCVCADLICKYVCYS